MREIFMGMGIGFMLLAMVAVYVLLGGFIL